jgi:hypothetical protein
MKQAADFEERGFAFDKYANYYKTMKRAKAAINWALSNYIHWRDQEYLSMGEYYINYEILLPHGTIEK